ncbi:hypothetical protein J6590_045201 [Homalodisca vitripennis]|nr:hypothetical protein J6590_045201 [Homalodisca vitripennis]
MPLEKSRSEMSEGISGASMSLASFSLDTYSSKTSRISLECSKASRSKFENSRNTAVSCQHYAVVSYRHALPPQLCIVAIICTTINLHLSNDTDFDYFAAILI